MRQRTASARVTVLGACLGAWTMLSALAFGGEPEVPALTVVPERVTLIGPDAVQQLAVEEPGVPIDRTTEARFTSEDPAIATVDEAGTVSGQGDGETAIRIELGDRQARVPVEVRRHADPPPIHFTNQIVPIFTKLGCNAGGCHGKSGGQNGFRLSLLGFEPELDYQTLVKEGRGRRVFPAAPEESLLLKKATAETPHGGGKRLEVGSHEYRLIQRWIKEGMPFGSAEAPTVARIELYPDARVLEQGEDQQLVVTAVYTDGSTEDVTRWAQYESNVAEVAEVEEGGRVVASDLAGQAAIMARYQARVAVFRATVPLDERYEGSFDFAPKNRIDELAMKQWERLGLAPSGLCTDREFVRRASLDITGTLPTAEDVRAFEDNSDPDKRAKLIDELLERPEYASYFAVKWADILRNKRENNAQYQRSTYRFYDWIRRQLAENTPYDRFVERILAANGSPETTPSVVWYRDLKQPDELVDDSAQVFLGMRLQCAKCHHHPFEKWSEDDYYSYAAFFGRIGRKSSLEAQLAGRDELVIFTKRSGAVRHPKTNEVMTPRPLGEPEPIELDASTDPRRELVDWLSEPDNPYFAPAVVNRYWAHFFGRGLVEPIDDMRATNPPSNPELLEALSDQFIASGFDLKQLIRTICASRLYGLSSAPNRYNERDTQSYARYYPKRMTAEVLHDAICQVTGVPTDFRGMPPGTRAIELRDESVPSNFLDAFGRPKRETACECERVMDASLSQSLMLLNSNEVQGKLGNKNGRAARLAKDERPHDIKVEELFLDAFGRPPTEEERETALGHIEQRADDVKGAYEDIIWALINAKEFQFID